MRIILDYHLVTAHMTPRGGLDMQITYPGLLLSDGAREEGWILD
jgi:hypothetical protein